MESYGNERKVQQGEDWNLDILLSASDREYIPYIISSGRINPFFVVTIASTKYEKNLRYVKSWWNSPSDLYIPTFYQTVPLKYMDNVAAVSDLPSSPVNNVDNATYDESQTGHRYLYYYTLADEEIDKNIGHKPYHYFYFEYDREGVVTGRHDGYECRIRFNFLSSETAKWNSQNYLYQITLVDGQLLEDTLNEIYNAYTPADWPNETEAQYRYVKARWPLELQPDIDATSPLGRIDHPEIILPPTKLEVFNNLRTII